MTAMSVVIPDKLDMIFKTNSKSAFAQVKQLQPL